MAGVVLQGPVQGFGYGIQGELIFNTSPDYAGIPNPEYDDDDGYSDDSDENEADPYDRLYADLDLSRVYGKQIVVWTHHHAETVALFTPVEGDTFVDLVKFARSTLQFNSAVDKMMVLLPGHKRPLEMDSVYHIRPGTAVLVTPLYDYVVTIEVKQLDHKVDMVLNIVTTVLELKGRLQTEQGYPAEQTELLYRDQPLENARYLFEYGVSHSSTLFVLLTMRLSTMVHVETFWGKRYHLYVDACTTGLEIIDSVLRRTVSQGVTDVVRLYELFLPKHTLVLYLGSRLVDWDHCLGLYGLEEGSVLRMTTIGLAHEMSLQQVPVKVMETGRVQFVQVSKFDRWSTVVLKLHGMTGYPVNLMRLVRGNNSSVDFSDSVGVIQPHAQSKATVKLDTSAVRADDDLTYGVTLRFTVSHGMNELLKVAPSRTIKSVKDTLEQVGVPNAAISDLVYRGHRLPNNKRVIEVIEEYKVPIDVSLRQYPVFIHGENNIIYRMLAHCKESVATFLMRVTMKAGLDFREHRLLSCGMVLREDEDTLVFNTRITPKSSIFLIPRQRYRPFLILHGDWLTKLRVPSNPNNQQIKDLLWKERGVPEGALASIGNFLQWYFGPQIRDGKYFQQKHPLKDQVMVYEQNIGNNVLKMKADMPNEEQKLRRKMRGVTVPAKKSNFDTTLEELERCAARHRRKPKCRAQTYPHGRLKHHNTQGQGNGTLPLLAGRHRAAAADGHARNRHKRKAYTTDANIDVNKLPAIPVPYLGRGGGVYQSQRRQCRTEPADERGGDDWVFSLTHEIVERPKRVKAGRRTCH